MILPLILATSLHFTPVSLEHIPEDSSHVSVILPSTHRKIYLLIDVSWKDGSQDGYSYMPYSGYSEESCVLTAKYLSSINGVQYFFADSPDTDKVKKIKFTCATTVGND